MATDRQRYDFPFSRNETYEKIRSIVMCPRCKEDYWGYFTKKGKKKGITIKSQQESMTLMSEDAPCREKYEYKRIYHCNVCGYTWQVKQIGVLGNMRIIYREEKIRKEERD